MNVGLATAGAIGALLVILASASAGASFTDRAVSAGNPVTLASLPAPQDLDVQATGGGPGAQLTWTTGTGDFATSWEVMRVSGDCSGGNPGEDDIIATEVPATQYLDESATYGAAYCYAVRGAFGAWISPASAPAPVSIPLPESTLYLDDATAGNDTTSAAKQLDVANQRGYERFGCVVYVVILGCIDVPLLPDAYSYTSSQDATVWSHEGWTMQFAYTSTTLASLLTGSTLSADAWYLPAGSQCGSPPATSASNYIAGTALSDASLLALLSGASGTATLPLTGNASMATSTGATLCLRLGLTGGGVLSLVSYLTVVHGAESWLRGPFTQP